MPIGSDENHAVEHGERLRRLGLLDMAQAKIVLQPQQHVAVANRRAMLRRQRHVAAGDGVHQLAQRDGVARAPAIEGIEDRPLAADSDAHEEVAGQRQPVHLPALGAGDVNGEDAEGDRKALATVDDAHEVGVLRVLVGQRIATIAIAPEQNLVERSNARVEGTSVARRAVDGVHQRSQMIAIDRHRAPGRLEHGERQRRLGQRQRFVRAATKRAQEGLRAGAVDEFAHLSGVTSIDCRGVGGEIA